MSCADMYIYGKQNVNIPAHLNFGIFILDRLRLKNEEIALINSKTRETMTYKELTQYAVNMATALKKLGVKRGDIVAIGAEKRNEYVPTILAIVLTGATCTPYDLNDGPATLKHKITIVKPQFFICSNHFWNKHGDILEKFKCINTFISIDDNVEPMISLKTLITNDIDINKFQPAQVHGHTDTAIILYSSGTTGMPKGIQLTHLNFILFCLPNEFEDDSLQTAYILGEWIYSYDLSTTFAFLNLGRKLVYVDEKYPNFFKHVEDYKINIVLAVPYFLCFILKINDAVKYNLEPLKYFFSVSTPLHNKYIEELKRRYPTVQSIQGYGMTEISYITTQMWAKDKIPGSVGMAAPCKILKVVELQTGRALGPNLLGEICALSPSLMKGYVGGNTCYLDEEGFLKSGDLGYYDDNKNFYVVERLNDTIAYQGTKISPMELEAILELHPSVREAGVVGKQVPDNDEEPTAFVVKQPGVQVTEQDLIEYVKKEVPPYMRLRGGVIFIEKIPRTTLGKKMRRLLRDML